ncbi:MAG: hypothetical protein ABI821_06025 [Pseudomonadota bacterium]
MASHFILAHGILHLQDLGHAATVGAGAIATMTVTGLLAKVVIGAGLVIIFNARTQLQVDMFATCLGIGFGGGIVCLMTVLGNYYGLKAFALLSGIAIAINTTLSALAAFIAGFLFDHGYGLAGWCFVGAVVLFVLRRPVYRAVA